MNLASRMATSFYLALRGRTEARIPFCSERTIHRRQTHHLQRMVRYAFKYVPHFRALADSSDLSPRSIRTCEDLARLPLIDGTMLHTDPLSFVSTAIPRASLLKLHSTGTAKFGAKIVYWHPRELMASLALGQRDRRILYRTIGKSRQLVRLSFFHPDSSTSQSSRFQNERLWIPSTIMKTQWASCELPFEEVVRLLHEVRPDVIYSYGSFAESFLAYVMDQALDVCLPKVWVFGGDGVTQAGRERIERELPCKLYSTYQAIEAGRIGFECEMGAGYHINTDYCHIRLIDEHGETAAPGDAGEVVISNLSNRGSVLLNCRIGDRAEWHGEPCPCGRTLPLLRLTGARTSSKLRLRDGQELQEHVILHACKGSIHDVLQLQIVERAPEEITWRVVLSKDADRGKILSDLIACSQSVMSPNADVRVEIVDRIVLAPGAKLTRIVRNDEPSDDVLA